MSSDRDPPRLVDESDTPEALKTLLETGRRDVATDGEVKALEARLAPLLWPTAGGAGGGAGGQAAGGSSAGGGAGAALKIGGAIAGAALIAGGTWLATQGDRSDSPAPQTPPVLQEQRPAEPPQTAGRAASPPATEATPPERTRVPPEQAEVEQQESRPQSRQVAPTPASPPATEKKERENRVAKPVQPPSEADLLNRARQALATRPARALTLAQQHQRLYSGGVLAQEREVIAIEALERLGREAEAASRARRFLDRYPGSAHRRKIETIIGP